VRRLTVTLFVLALLASACGGSGSFTGDSVRSALATTKKAKSASYTLVIAISPVVATTTTAAKDSAAVELRVKGVWDIERSAVKSQVDYATSAGGGSADYIVIRQVVYSSLGMEKGKWQRFDQAEGGVGQDSLGVLRPTPVLEMLSGMGKHVTKVGTARIGGERTTEYKGTVDLRRASTAADKDTREAIAARRDSTQGAALDVHVWIDGADRIRRVVTFSTAAEGKSTIKTTLELSSFGVAAKIDEPTADQFVRVTTTTTSAPAG
jgi:hypothetical protein